MLALFMVVCIATAAPADPAAPTPVLLSVGLPAIEGKRTLEIGGTIPIIMTNTSLKPIGICRDNNSWGYYSLSLEFRDTSVRANDETGEILKKKARTWIGNFPIEAELAPGESMIFTLQLKETVWKDFDYLKTRFGKKVYMRVNYRIDKGEMVLLSKVWYGSLQTAYQEYTITKSP